MPVKSHVEEDDGLSITTHFLKQPPPDEALSSTTGGGSGHHGFFWDRGEKIAWLGTLLAGTTLLYSSRTTAPLVAPSLSEDMKWSKTEVGTVLSSFFWGYTLTQVLGGYLSDRFGAERILLAAGAGWALLTFWFHQIVYFFPERSRAFNFIILTRVLLGACQGVHFPSMASLTSRKLPSRDRAFFFSVTTGGSAVGTILTGSLGSYVNEHFGWPAVFYTIGCLSLFWVAVLRFYAIHKSRSKQQVINLDAGSYAPLLGNGHPGHQAADPVPWLVYLKAPSLWACTFCHFCQNNCFFILLSWLPTYFHDNFPGEPSWVFNFVPWTVMIPGLATAAFLSSKLLSNGVSVTRTRKIIESTCMITEAFCLVLIGNRSFTTAIVLISVALFAGSFHNFSVVAAPQDIAPKHAGSIFGIMNATGSIPGNTKRFAFALLWTTVAIFAKNFHSFGCTVNPLDIAPKHSGSVHGISNTFSAMSGFVGVYLAGYILDVTGKWQAVFNATAVINLIGISVFLLFGSGNPIL